MEENIYDKSRRDFIKLSSLAAFALHPTVSLLSKILNTNGNEVEKYFNDDFHYFGNNLTNLHFYFINAKIEGKRLNQLPNTGEAFMVVKIPQQHIQEQLLREKSDSGKGGFDPDYINSDRRTESKISGFSFLAFKLFPTKVTVQSKDKSTITVATKRKPFIDLNDINNLLNWNNPSLYELLIPTKEDYKGFTNIDWTTFEKNNESSIVDDEVKPSSGYICKLYRDICREVFKENCFPLTVLEIPEGLLVSPYSQDGVTLFADTYRIPKTRFVYNGSKGKVVRTVEEIWSAQLFFETAEGRQSPPLRGVGYIPRKDKKPVRDNGDCPDEAITYLPTLLDKNELVYLTSLGRGNNAGKEWDIETRGLTLTGLGAIAKFHYKNFTPPKSSDLAEYEHHFTLGRDEYIKVARIGVISVTGQKALHVKIGQRKIKNGTSYMEFKEYIEIIQKEISYFADDLFIKDEPNKREPYNYIQVRNFPPSQKKDGIIHSYDDIYDGNINSDNTNDVWIDKAIWNLNILPDKWNTHYKRWAFVKINSVKSVTPPIVTTKNDVKPDTIINCGECSPNNPLAFWPILETDKSDSYLGFKGLDWNNKEIHFSSTFMFIRKSLIETGLNDNCIKEIYNNFSTGRIERRQIRFINSEIAYTSDYSSKSSIKGNKEELPNKSNVAKTDFIEYYFSLCKEPIGKTLVYEDKKIEPSSDSPIPTESIFNERLFPLFPQIKRAQLYLENIQSYTPEPLPSIIEYNEDFVNYGFERKKIVIDKATNQNVEVIYNKSRLVFNHTDDFIKNKSKILDYNNGIWEEKKFEGYKRIKQAFGGAGNAIGGLVNPDFDIQSIGLVKQSIAVGKDINKKYEQVTEFTDKIEKFNPSDLLRQAPEIFNGISLIDILQEVFPDYEAPINDIKNVASKIDTIKNELLENPIYLEIKADLDFVNKKIETFVKKIEEIQNDIDSARKEVLALKDIFNSAFFVSEIENLLKSAVSKYKLSFIEEINGTANIAKSSLDKITEYLTSELISKAEVIYPYYQILNDAKLKFEEIKKIKDISPKIVSIIDDYINVHFQKDLYILIDIEAKDKTQILQKYDVIQSLIKVRIDEYYKPYSSYSSAVNNELVAFKKYSNSKITYEKYLGFKKITQDAFKLYTSSLIKITNIKEKASSLIKNLKNDSSEFEKIKQFESDISNIQTAVVTLSEFNETINLPHYIDTFNKTLLDFNTFKSKLPSDILKLDIEGIINFIDDINGEVKNDITLKRDELNNLYKSEYKNLKDDFNKLISDPLIGNALKGYNLFLTKDLLDNLLNKITSTSDFQDQLIKINEVQGNIENGLKLLSEKVKEYESYLKNPELIINGFKSNIIELIKLKIEEKEKELLNDPENQDLINAFIKGKELLNILSTLTKKEINYNWQTSSFKNADFGIVSFLASNNPKTSLSVNVKNTIYFQPNKFPAVIQKIDSIAENRLNNFSISLLKAIILNFNEVSFVVGTNRSPKFEVKIRDVQFAGAFSFVQALESLFKDLLGDNFSVRISPQNVEVEYLLPIAYVGAPSFGFKNILFRVLYTLHFNKKPMELGVGIGSPINRTILSVGVYTGLFYFIVIGNPKQGITTIEVSIEFGGYYGLSLGPLRGEVKLVVGLYYRKDLLGVIIEGYFLCEGRVKLWFVMVTARFYMGVRSQGGYVEGRCTVSYEIRLSRFFKRSFTATYYKKLAGASPGNNQSGSMQKALNFYKSLNQISLSDENFTKLSHTEQLEKVINPVTRKVKPLTEKEWETFINSYID